MLEGHSVFLQVSYWNELFGPSVLALWPLNVQWIVAEPSDDIGPPRGTADAVARCVRQSLVLRDLGDALPQFLAKMTLPPEVAPNSALTGPDLGVLESDDKNWLRKDFEMSIAELKKRVQTQFCYLSEVQTGHATVQCRLPCGNSRFVRFAFTLAVRGEVHGLSLAPICDWLHTELTTFALMFARIFADVDWNEVEQRSVTCAMRRSTDVDNVDSDSDNDRDSDDLNHAVDDTVDESTATDTAASTVTDTHNRSHRSANGFSELTAVLDQLRQLLPATSRSLTRHLMPFAALRLAGPLREWCTSLQLQHSSGDETHCGTATGAESFELYRVSDTPEFLPVMLHFSLSWLHRQSSFSKEFVAMCITAHLQMGRTVVVGSSAQRVQMMLATLFSFIEESEEPQVQMLKRHTLRISPLWTLQGLVIPGKYSIGSINAMDCVFPFVVIDLDSLAVWHTSAPHMFRYAREELAQELATLVKDIITDRRPEDTLRIPVRVPRDNELWTRDDLLPCVGLMRLQSAAPYIAKLTSWIAALPLSLRKTYTRQAIRIIRYKAAMLLAYLQDQVQLSDAPMRHEARRKIQSDLQIRDEHDLRVIAAVAARYEDDVFERLFDSPRVNRRIMAIFDAF